MVLRKIGETGSGFVEPTVPLSSTEDKIALADIQSLQASVDNLANAINGNLSLGDGTPSSRAGNFDAQVIEFVTDATPDTEFAVPHGLKRRPVYFLPLLQVDPGVLYGSRPGSWTDKVMYFKCTEASVRRLVALF